MSLQYWGTQIERLHVRKPYFLRSTKQPDYFTRVPPDIFLYLARFLALRELIIMRLTCRKFYKLTHDAAIWKPRYKEAAKLWSQLPPVPFSSFETLTSAVCEQTLRRAHAIESEWQRKECRPAHNFFNVLGQVHSMSMLPGGRFLAICASSNDEFALFIWDLEVPSSNPFVPEKRRAALAKTIVPCKVTEMTTKYLQHQSKNGIAIAVSGPTDKCGPNGNFWAVYWTPLNTLEEFSKTQSRPDATALQLRATVKEWQGPFKTLAQKYTHSLIHSLCLETVGEQPLVALVRNAKDIVVQYLDSSKRSFITPVDPWEINNGEHPPWAQHGNVIIRAIKVLPAQRKLLVIREVRHAAPVWPVFWYAIYPIPEEGACLKDAPYEVQFQEADIKSIDFFSFSDELYRNDPMMSGGSMDSNTGKQNLDISIWAVNDGTTASDGLPSVILRRVKPVAHADPEGMEQDQGTNLPEYQLDPLRLRFPGDRPIAIAGGTRRGIWFLPLRNSKHVPGSMRVGEILRYMATEMDPTLSSEEVLRKELVNIQIPEPLLKGLRGGMAAYAFDESIGRLLIATHDDELVHVLDFSDHVGVNWASNICKTH